MSFLITKLLTVTPNRTKKLLEMEDESLEDGNLFMEKTNYFFVMARVALP